MLRTVLVKTCLLSATLGFLLVANTEARAQEPKTLYVSQLELGFPVPRELLDRKPRPTKLRLYSASNRGKFQQVAERDADKLDAIANRPPGFQYVAKSDGEEEFAVQLVFEDGRVVPTLDRLRTDYRIIFDTRPPVVNLAADGTYGVAWSAQDENLDPETIRLECRYQDGASTWHNVRKARGSFSARDSYTWTGLAKENRTLEVRVSAKDKAGHEASSRIVRLPSTGGAGAKLDSSSETTPRSTSPSFSGAGRAGGDWSGDMPNQPSIEYKNKRDLIVKSKLQTVTRSGVKAVHLFWKDMGRSPNGEWMAAKPLACDKPFGTVDLDVDIPHTVAEDGRYGFIVIPESGAGNREPNPRSVAAPQHLVEVDTIAPVVKGLRAIPTPGGTTGTRLEVEWDAFDINLQTDPIDILFAADPNGPWTPVAEKIPNSRRYVWDVPEKTPFKIHVKVKATDKALNSGELASGPVIIDLDKPSAVIPRVETNGTGVAPKPVAIPAAAPVVTTPAAPGAGSPVQPVSTVPDKILPIPNGR